MNRHSVSSVSLMTLVILAGASLTGCSTVETQGFRVSKSSSVDVGYLATDADFSQYEKLLVDELGIYFPTGSTVPSDDLAQIRSIFREAFSAQLAEYDVTQQDGPDMLRITASLVDLRHASADELPKLRGDLDDIVAPGELLFIMELRDSSTGRILARAGDSQAAPDFEKNGSDSTNWSEIRKAAEYWAATFRAFLDKNLARKVTDKPAKSKPQ